MLTETVLPFDEFVAQSQCFSHNIIEVEKLITISINTEIREPNVKVSTTFTLT